MTQIVRSWTRVRCATILRHLQYVIYIRNFNTNAHTSLCLMERNPEPLKTYPQFDHHCFKPHPPQIFQPCQLSDKGLAWSGADLQRRAQWETAGKPGDQSPGTAWLT